jgi:hypothetical protein
MADLLTPMNRKNDLKRQLAELFTCNKDIPIFKLGFTDNWQESPIWNAQ